MSSSFSSASSRPHLLRRTFQGVAALVLLASAGFWLAKGAHTGWSQNRVPIPGVDEVTGLEFVRYEDRYLPGIEWPLGGMFVAILLSGTSLLFRSNPKSSA